MAGASCAGRTGVGDYPTNIHLCARQIGPDKGPIFRCTKDPTDLFDDLGGKDLVMGPAVIVDGQP